MCIRDSSDPLVARRRHGLSECCAARGLNSAIFQCHHLYDEGDVCTIRTFVADDDSMESDLVKIDRQGKGKRVVVADPTRCSDPMGNLEGEVFVVHHRSVVDALDVDRKTERVVVLVEGNLDDDGQAHDVAKGKIRRLDVVLESRLNVERPSGRIHLDVVGDECAFDPHRTETRRSPRPSSRSGASVVRSSQRRALRSLCRRFASDPQRHLCHTLSESDEGPPVAVLLIEMDTASWYRWFASAVARRTLHPLPGIPGHHLDHGRGTDQGCCWEPQTWMTARGIRSGSSGN